MEHSKSAGNFGKTQEPQKQRSSFWDEFDLDTSNEEESSEKNQIFSKEFVEHFKKLKEILQKNSIYLFVHGTNETDAETILEDGLWCKQPDITHTAINMTGDFEEGDLEILANWPHRSSKHLVMIGLPYSVRVWSGNPKAFPVWKEIEDEEKEEVSEDGWDDGFDMGYLLANEYIIGYIDVEDQKIIPNPLFKADHDLNDDLDWDKGLNPYPRSGFLGSSKN